MKIWLFNGLVVDDDDLKIMWASSYSVLSFELWMSELIDLNVLGLLV